MNPERFCCDSCGTEAVMNLHHAAPNSLQSNGWVRLRKKTCWLYFCSECWDNLMRKVGKGEFLL